jgi:hypothetical protein
MEIGEIDPRAVGATNELPKLTPEQAAARTWRPDAATWAAIKEGSTEREAVLTITGYADEGSRRPLSRGRVSIRTSTDPVGAPVFYRDVPLMPSEGRRASSSRWTRSSSPSSPGGCATWPRRRAGCC